MKINHPNSFIAFFSIPYKSTNISVPNVVKLPIYTNRWTSRTLEFLADHVQILKPNAQAPAIRVFRIPTRFVVLSKRERLCSGKNKKKIAFRKVRNAEMVVIVLNFIECHQSYWTMNSKFEKFVTSEKISYYA